jgi:putative colanic acid biosynthesis UDP-glucose lipid carrier transferase
MIKRNLTFNSQLFLLVDATLSFSFGLILACFLDINQLNIYVYVLLGVLFLQIFIFRNSYQGWRLTSISEHLRVVVKDWLGIFLIIITILFLIKKTGDFSRVWLISWFLCIAVSSVILRILLLHWLRKNRANGNNIIKIGLICDQSTHSYVNEKIYSYSWSGYQVSELINISEGDCYKDLNIQNCQELWVALPMGQQSFLQEILDYFKHQSIDIRYIPSMSEFLMLNHSISHILDMTFINLSSTPLDYQGDFLKRIEDILLSIFFLVILSPIMLIICLLIKLTSSGPILFKQRRHGWNGELFYVYKFRSMYLHDDLIGVVTQAKADDKRVTPFGRFLRKSSLDELPQFMNVLKGEMSIVGPRPHAVEHNNYYKELIPKYMWRHKVKPGITGWAQINGFRGETNTVELMKKRIEYDLFYIENWSIWLDLRIIYMTCYKIFNTKNAY